MMVHKPCVKEIVIVYDEAQEEVDYFLWVPMPNRCHLYQGRDPDAYPRHLLDDRNMVGQQSKE